MAKAKKRMVRPLIQPKPPGTRCYVPGYMDDQTQFAIDQSQLGIAPLAIASTAVSAGKVLGISFKKSPRVFGGPLVSTVNDHQRRVEAGDVSAVNNMDNARKTAKDKAAWQRIWSEMLPTWRIGSQAVYERIKQLDPSLPVMAPASAAATPVSVPAPTIAPAAPPPPGVTPPAVPSIGPITFTLPGAPAPAPIPPPPQMLPGGEPQVPVEVAQPPIQQAGMFGGDMGKLMIPGLVLLGISLLTKKGR